MVVVVGGGKRPPSPPDPPRPPSRFVVVVVAAGAAVVEVVEVVAVVVVVVVAGRPGQLGNRLGNKKLQSKPKLKNPQGLAPPTAPETSDTSTVESEKTAVIERMTRREGRAPRVMRPGFAWRPRCRSLT